MLVQRAVPSFAKISHRAPVKFADTLGCNSGAAAWAVWKKTLPGRTQERRVCPRARVCCAFHPILLTLLYPRMLNFARHTFKRPSSNAPARGALRVRDLERAMH